MTQATPANSTLLLERRLIVERASVNGSMIGSKAQLGTTNLNNKM
jgi:hypothetical protein